MFPVNTGLVRLGLYVSRCEWFSSLLTTDTLQKFFNYEAFYKDEVDRKKNDHTYRVFRKVTRKGSDFPLAEECSDDKKDITVWCSNDYLGMSWHPKVQTAVM